MVGGLKAVTDWANDKARQACAKVYVHLSSLPGPRYRGVKLLIGPLFCWANPHTARLDGHDGPSGKFLSVALYCGDGDGSLVFSAQRYESQDPNVRTLPHDCEFAEILVESNQELLVAEGVGEYIIVTWVVRPIRHAFDSVAGRQQRLASASPYARIKEDLHGSAGCQRWLDSFVADQSPSICEACADVVDFHPGIPLQDHIGCIASGKHSQYVFHRKPVTTHDRLSREDRRIDRDPVQEAFFVRARIIGHCNTILARLADC